MAPPSDADVTFVTGFVVRKDLVYVLIEESLDDSNPGFAFKYVRQQEWHGVTVPFPGLVAIDALPGPETEFASELTIVSVEGDVYRSSDARQGASTLDASADGPSSRGWIRSMRRIGKKLYAVGMSRQVYESGPGDAWRHIDAGILSKPGQTAGLNDIDGFSARELYSAGLQGEIWRYDGKRWHAIESPTNVQLHAVRRCGEVIYIAGGSGVLLRGRGDQFEVVATEEDELNLHAVESLGKHIYVASLTGLYRLRDDVLDEVDTGLKAPITTGSLHAADGVLWSVGAKHLITTEDGATWTQRFI